MITIRRKFNIKTVKIRGDTFENVGVLQPDGTIHYNRYIDAIDRRKVSLLPYARSVKLESEGFRLTDSMNEPWVDLKDHQFLMGAEIESGVFLVTNHGEPIIV